MHKRSNRHVLAHKVHTVASAIFLTVISLGAIAAGAGYVKTARRMRDYLTTRGRVIGRDIDMVATGGPDPKWGKGGGWAPKITFTYTVAGTTYTSDRATYARRGLKKELAREAADAVPDEVDVHYDADDPGQAFLEKHTPGIGRALIAGGCVGVLVAAIILMA
jgi:hypothetical protein